MGEASDFGDRRYAEDDHRDRCVTRHRRCRVVSLPSWDIFEHQPQSYREEVLPSRVEARTAVERGSVLGWDKCRRGRPFRRHEDLWGVGGAQGAAAQVWL